ncbi:hypothetical protein AAFM46_16445 (plasmid) [Arthrobacter sp. TMP15]|uniref:hypothetical protein n=1 Tax=Arthrobacter sp. TMP15 TaxID=3140789 RepID=UPI0031B9EB2E
MAQKVVVSHRGTEIHGYVLAREGNRVHIAWTVASGRRRSRTFHAETVFLSGDDRRWKEKHIPIERLDTIGQGAL